MARPQGNEKQIDQSTIPPAVRRAAEEAERLLAAQNPKPDEPESKPQEPAPENTPPAPTNPEPPRAANPEPVTPEGKPPAPQPPEDPNDESWKRRFESEQGRTNKLRKDVQELSQQVDNLTRVLSTIQTAPAPADDPQMRFEKPKYVTPEMETEWGPEFFKAVDARARELIEPLERQFEDKLKTLGGTVEKVVNTQVTATRQDMLKALDNDSYVSDWRIINDDPDFVAWLKYPDAMSGRVRHNMLIEAFNANDASRVAAFFAQYKRENAIAPAAPQTAQPGTPATPPKPSLDQFVAPGRARSAPAPVAGAEDEPITRSDVARFYADKAAGRFNTPELEAKAKAYEAQIFKATQEGRIFP